MAILLLFVPHISLRKLNVLREMSKDPRKLLILLEASRRIELLYTDLQSAA